jgi:hypothetical protein
MDFLPFKGGNACGFLSPMLESIEPEIGQFGYFFLGGVKTKYSASFLGFIGRPFT